MKSFTGHVPLPDLEPRAGRWLAADETSAFDDAPPPAGPADYGLPADISKAGLSPSVKLEARQYQFTDPVTIPRRDRLYGSHLFRGVCTAMVAPGGVGKSTLSVGETLARVTNRPLLGARAYARPLRCWLWNLEDPLDELTRKVQAACIQHEISPDELGGHLFVNGREDGLVMARSTPSGGSVVEPVIESLVAEIRRRKIDVLTIDPFVSCHQVAENDNNLIDAVVKAWGRVAGSGNCAVELVHHARKLGPDAEVTAESARGAVAMVAACRAVRVLNRMTKDEGERAGVENHRLFFRVYTDKANLAPPADAAEWYRLGSVDLGNGPVGESDSVQAVVRWEWPDALDGVTANDLFSVQKVISEGEWREDSRAEKWAGYAVAKALNLDPQSAPVQTRLKSLLKTWIETGALKVVRRADEHRKDRNFVEVGQWATPL